MNISGIISRFFGLLDGLLNRIDRRTAATIRNGFFGIVFILMVIGAFMGYNMGTDSARIKSPSIISTTDEIFDIDISRSRPEGAFSEMLDTENIREGEYRPPERIAYPSQEKIEPEAEEGVIETPTIMKRRRTPLSAEEEPVMEGEYRQSQYRKGDVREVGKNVRTGESASDIITGDEEKAREPLAEEAAPTAADKSQGTKGLHRIRRREPQPMTDDAGILGR
ncbi:MAG: hypothetical protein JXA20_04235 [Spirochaetes bacterium]|nr:hypothetical protein [Spirochaetota bacterium]